VTAAVTLAACRQSPIVPAALLEPTPVTTPVFNVPPLDAGNVAQLSELAAFQGKPGSPIAAITFNRTADAIASVALSDTLFRIDLKSREIVSHAITSVSLGEAVFGSNGRDLVTFTKLKAKDMGSATGDINCAGLRPRVQPRRPAVRLRRREWRRPRVGVCAKIGLRVNSILPTVIMISEVDMTLVEVIQQQLNSLPPEKQSEVLDFIAFLQQRISQPRPTQRHSLKQHAAFGAWKNRNIDAIEYQQNLRAEWDTPA
jgi:hypothetical protein